MQLGAGGSKYKRRSLIIPQMYPMKAGETVPLQSAIRDFAGRDRKTGQTVDPATLGGSE